jgi:hypothetical protein
MCVVVASRRELLALAGGSPALAHPDFWFSPVPVAELCTIWIRHHGVASGEVAGVLALELEVNGYPVDTEEVAAADAVEMTHRVCSR